MADWDEDSHPRDDRGRFGGGGGGHEGGAISHALGFPSREVAPHERQAFLKGVQQRAQREADVASRKPGLGASLKAWASKAIGERKASQASAGTKLGPAKGKHSSDIEAPRRLDRAPGIAPKKLTPGSGTVDKLMRGDVFEHKYPNGSKATVQMKSGKIHIDSDKANVEAGVWSSGGSDRAKAHMAIAHVLSAAERE
jgi:hypothetical protein